MASTWVKRAEGTIETTSKLKVWWLNTFHGYRVLEEKLAPHRRAFGRIGYVRVWILKPTSVAGKAGS